MKILPLGLAICVLSVSGCVSTQDTPNTRKDTAALMFSQSGSEVQTLHHQALALDSMADAIVKNAARKGAVIGGVIGCGVGLALANSAGNCVVGAVALGVAGHEVGRAQGKRIVQDRMALAASSDLSRDLRSANDQVSFISNELDIVIHQQNTRIGELQKDYKTGRISTQTYRAGIGAIHKDRESLAAVLDKSLSKTKKANAALQSAASNGDRTIIKQAQAAKRLETRIASQRARVDLLSLSALGG